MKSLTIESFLFPCDPLLVATLTSSRLGTTSFNTWSTVGRSELMVSTLKSKTLQQLLPIGHHRVFYVCYNTFAFLYIESCRRIFIFPPFPSSKKISRGETRSEFLRIDLKKKNFSPIKKKSIRLFFFSFVFLFFRPNFERSSFSRIFHYLVVSLSPLSGKNFYRII